MTNYEKYFGTPEQVARFIDGYIEYCGECPAYSACRYKDACNCKKNALEWLQEECDE